MKHATHVSVVARGTLRASCICGWSGSKFVAEEIADVYTAAHREGHEHERIETANANGAQVTA